MLSEQLTDLLFEKTELNWVHFDWNIYNLTEREAVE